MWNNIKYFFKAQASNIIVTIIGGLVPVVFNGIYKIFINSGSRSSESSNKSSFDLSNFEISNIENYAIHSVFIFITLYVLIQIRKNTMHDIKNNKGQIKQYMLKNCGLKIYDHDETLESAFKTVQVSASQFFYAWLAVWLVWLIFYAGEYLLSINFNNDSIVMKSFEQAFDFLNSTAMISIYIILTNVTVNYKKRAKNSNTYLEFILVWMILLIICVSGILTENHHPESVFAHVMPFYISAVSTISFVLILGKLNSIYLKIPSFFMYVLYVYAFIQTYIPLRGLEIKENEWIRSFLIFSVPYFTLLGKVILMLTICWISVQRRFIFYLIHRSTTIDKAEELLSELNKEKVSF